MSGSLAPVERSRQFLLAVRAGRDPQEQRDQLAALDSKPLSESLSTTRAKTAFWLNLYNGCLHSTLAENPDQLESRWRFFRRDCITVADTGLSPNDIEHGLLRNSMASWGFGYIPRLFLSPFERTHRVETVDPRIHFALNCGASSCPLVRLYDAETLEETLEEATSTYLRDTVEYDGEANEVHVPRVCWWYRGDFGGKAGTLDLLHRTGVVPPGRNPQLRYQDWDWSLDLESFAGRSL